MVEQSVESQRFLFKAEQSVKSQGFLFMVEHSVESQRFLFLVELSVESQGFLFTEASRSRSTHTKISSNPLDEWSVCRSILYLTHNTQRRKTSKPSTEFKPAISANERPQTHTFNRAAAGIS
jgi:hypothetical protein